MASEDMTDAAAPEEEKIKVSRREFLNLAWLASLGFFLVPFGGVTLLFAYPRFREGEFGGTFTLKAADLPAPNTTPGVNTTGKFWLTVAEDGLRAPYKVCTHLGCLYNWQEQEFKFICPCHGSQFNYQSIKVGGPAPRSLDLFKITVKRGEEILAETSEDEGNQPVPVFDDPEVVYIVDTGKRITGQKATV
jgi:cytochrome b6-f complex iron-sulfur subunit